MGEEKKEEEKKESGEGEKNKEEEKGEKEEEKKEEGEKKEDGGDGEKKAEEENPEIVLKVDMHCEGCARKVQRALRGFPGVEEVHTDSKSRKVVVKGKVADPVKVSERIQKKSGKKVEIISPLPKPPAPEEKKEEKEEPKPQEKKEEPVVVTIVLSIRMHCESCAQVVQRRIHKMKGVESVETDSLHDQVIVKGIVDPAKLVDYVYKQTGKQATIVPPPPPPPPEEKKEEEKKEEKCEDGKKEGEDESKGGEEEKKSDVKKSEYWPQRYYMEYYAYPPPQMFSDENPNACSVM